jgi:acyl-CoA reductase-like NAD-dependent aldehyde dehydrogenase
MDRIQLKIEELKMKPRSFFTPSPTYEALHEEATRIVQDEIAKEEELKKRMQQNQEERERIEKKWIEALERKQQEKKEEEEREQGRILQEKEDPDKPLTIKDLRAIPGFYYNDYNRALEELNVEILKRIARQTYAHKFNVRTP